MAVCHYLAIFLWVREASSIVLLYFQAEGSLSEDIKTITLNVGWVRRYRPIGVKS